MTTFQLALLVWANGIFDVSVYAVFRASYFFRRKAPRPQDGSRRQDDVILIRPCHGSEPALGLTLGSTCAMQGLDGASVVFALPDAHDSARSAAERAVGQLRAEGMDAKVAITTREGPNNKALQLTHVLATAGGERTVVVIVDSDIDLHDTDLRDLTQPLRDSPKLGAVYAPPVEAPLTPTLGDRLSSAILTNSVHAFPLLSMLDGRLMVGKCFAVRRASLERCGGFESLGNVLGEDVELAKQLRKLGETIAPAPFLVKSRAFGRTPTDVVARFTRWLTVIRRQRGHLLLSYPLLLAGTIPLCAAALASGVSSVSIVAIVLAVSARLLTARLGARLAGSRAPLPHIIAAAEVLIGVAFLRALFSRTVGWRGRRFFVGSGGRMRSDHSTLSDAVQVDTDNDPAHGAAVRLTSYPNAGSETRM